MKSFIDKSRDKQSVSIAAGDGNRQPQTSALHFADNRSEALQLKKMQMTAESGPQVRLFEAHQEKADNSIRAKHSEQIQRVASDCLVARQGVVQKQGERSVFSNNPLNNLGPVQLYSDAGGKKRTENDSYVVCHGGGDDQSKLYVAPGAGAPHPGNLIIGTGRNKNIAGVTYREYHYDPGRSYTNDCLTFAENLVRGTDADSDRAELRATGDRPQGTDRLFGQTDAQNRSIARGAWATGQGSNPSIGEAYGVTRTRLPYVGETPYHIATVVAKDGVDNVTLEADAGNAGQAAPVFDIYDTTPAAARANPLSLTFEETYAATYAPTATGVLRRR